MYFFLVRASEFIPRSAIRSGYYTENVLFFIYWFAWVGILQDIYQRYNNKWILHFKILQHKFKKPVQLDPGQKLGQFR